MLYSCVTMHILFLSEPQRKNQPSHNGVGNHEPSIPLEMLGGTDNSFAKYGPNVSAD